MATYLNGGAEMAGQPLLSTSAVPMQRIGERVQSNDGREFVYGKAGGVATLAGKLYQAPAEVTTHQDLTPVAAAIGATQITVTLGATNAATANQYADGWALITVTPGVGKQFKIKSHPAAAASATLLLTLEDPLDVALTTSSRIDLVANPYNGVIVNPTTATSAPIGVSVFPLGAGEFGWFQTRGVANVLADGAVTVGTNVAASNAVAGAIEPATGVQALIGKAVTGIADTNYGAVLLNL